MEFAMKFPSGSTFCILVEDGANAVSHEIGLENTSAWTMMVFPSDGATALIFNVNGAPEKCR